MEKKKILVVDDEADFAKMVKIRLEADNFEVMIANNGIEAIKKIEKEKPDAVLLDVMMPEIDGLSVLRQIRSKDARLPVFVVTAFSNEERIKIAAKLNASGFILKSDTDLSSEIKNIKSAIEIARKFKV
jgi:CheY-like chemotaxis protein